MLTSVRPITSIADLELNTLWDGFFHVAAFVLTAIGIGLIWRSRSTSTREPRSNSPKSSASLVGALLIGAGSFNLIEGLLDHHILQIHHVKPGPNELAWDLGFLALGAVLAVLGWLILQIQQKSIAVE